MWVLWDRGKMTQMTTEAVPEVVGQCVRTLTIQALYGNELAHT